MKRHPDWPERLNAYVAAGESAAFRWGKTDCGLWACGAVTAMTGVDPGAELRGRYRSRRGAIAALQAFAGGGLRETVERVAARFDIAPLPSPLYAQRGDWVLARGAEDWPDALGVCVGGDAVFLTPSGLQRSRLGDALAAWRV